MGATVADSPLHLRDDQLLLYAAGESAEPQGRQTSAHLEDCATCRRRLAELLCILDEIRSAHQQIAGQPLPSWRGPRALLKAQLGHLSGRSVSERFKRSSWTFPRPLGRWGRGVAVAGIALLVILLTHRALQPSDPTPRLVLTRPLDMPDARFTPGAVVAATQQQVCSDSEASASIPPAMKTQVLRLYGVAGAQSDAYEVDYLVTPELGGATDIHNLWPEPYENTVWNAHVKDQLEDRLRELVCHGDLDLATAQRDISADWIAAYRKYFHVNQPLPASSSTRIQI